MRTINTKKKKTTHGPQRDERVSRREKRKNIAGVEDVFFSSVRGRVFFRAKRRRRRRRRSRAFIRSGDFFFLKGAFKKGCCVIFFFSKGRSKKGVALSRFPKRKARETNARQTRRTEHNNDDDDDDDDVFFFVFFFSAHARAQPVWDLFLLGSDDVDGRGFQRRWLHSCAEE